MNRFEPQRHVFSLVSLCFLFWCLSSSALIQRFFRSLTELLTWFSLNFYSLRSNIWLFKKVGLQEVSICVSLPFTFEKANWMKYFSVPYWLVTTSQRSKTLFNKNSDPFKYLQGLWSSIWEIWFLSPLDPFWSDIFHSWAPQFLFSPLALRFGISGREFLSGFFRFYSCLSFFTETVILLIFELQSNLSLEQRQFINHQSQLSPKLYQHSS